MFVDAGYTGVETREEIVAQHPGVEFVVAEKRGEIKAMPEGELNPKTEVGAKKWF